MGIPKRKSIAVLVIVFLISGCAPSTFLVSKNGRAYYFGRESRESYTMLCEQGVLKKVISEAKLPEKLGKDFIEYTCSDDRSEEKVISTYSFLTPEEKKRLKRAFIRNGFTINYVPCC